MRTRRYFGWLLIVGVAGMLWACGSSNDNENPPLRDAFLHPDGTPRTFGFFDPGPEVIPLPNDVVWLADGDGTR